MLGNITELLGGVFGGLQGAAKGSLGKHEGDKPPIGTQTLLVGWDGDGFVDSVVGTTGVPKQHATITCPAGVYTDIWQYTVKAQQAIAVGYGHPDQPMNQGLFYFIGKSNHATAPVLQEGTLRIFVGDYHDRNRQPLWEGRTEQLHPATQDRQNMTPLPNLGDKSIVTEDNKITIQFKPDAAVVLGWGAEITDAGGDCSLFRMPCTMYD